MPLGSILLALIIGGALAYLIGFLPIHELFKKVAVVIIVLVVLLYCINAMGLISFLDNLGGARRR